MHRFHWKLRLMIHNFHWFWNTHRLVTNAQFIRSTIALPGYSALTLSVAHTMFSLASCRCYSFFQTSWSQHKSPRLSLSIAMAMAECQSPTEGSVLSEFSQCAPPPSALPVCFMLLAALCETVWRQHTVMLLLQGFLTPCALLLPDVRVTACQR